MFKLYKNELFCQYVIRYITIVPRPSPNSAFHVYYCTESIVDVAGISTTGCADRKSMKICAVLVSIMFVVKLQNLCDD